MHQYNEDNEGNESFRIVDTTKILTMDELIELKKLAQLSKASRVVIGVLFGVLTLTGIPSIVEWFTRHVH